MGQATQKYQSGRYGRTTNMRNLIAVFLMALATNASAYTVRYRIALPDGKTIRERLEAATGLRFEGKCRVPLGPNDVCPEEQRLSIHGRINTREGHVLVEVYEQTTADSRVEPVRVTAALRTKIDAAVLDQ